MTWVTILLRATPWPACHIPVGAPLHAVPAGHMQGPLLERMYALHLTAVFFVGTVHALGNFLWLTMLKVACKLQGSWACGKHSLCIGVQQFSSFH